MQDKITTISYAGSTAAVAAGALELNQLIAIAGLVVGIATFFINWLYQHKKHQLDKDMADSLLKGVQDQLAKDVKDLEDTYEKKTIKALKGEEWKD